MISLKIDIHIHTAHSDSTASVDDVLRVSEQKKLDGIVITDHDTMKGFKEAKSKRSSLIIIPGEEVTTKKGHILAIGIEETIDKGLPVDSAIYQIHKQKGLAIIPHPTFPLFGKLTEKELSKLQIDGIEVFSAATPFARHYLRRNHKLAQNLSLPMVAGSDSHFAETIGDAYTIVYPEDREMPSIIKAIKQGKTQISYRPSRTFYKIRMIQKLGFKILQ